MTQAPRLAVCTMAGTDLGLGHAVRSCRLAEALNHHAQIRLFLTCYRPAEQFFRRAGLALETVRAPVNSEEEIRRTLKKLKAFAPKVVLFDRLAPPLALVAGARNLARRVVLLDDQGEATRLADVVINGIIEPENVRSIRKGIRFYGGPDYLVLDPALRTLRPRKTRKRLRAVTVSLGGSDPQHNTARVVEGLLRFPHPLTIHVILGPDPSGGSGLAALDWQAASASHRLQVHTNLSSLAPVFAECDAAITGGGLTMFESLCAGLPTLAIAQVPHQARTIGRLKRRGLVILLGRSRAFAATSLPRRLQALSFSRRYRLRERALSYVDGQGLQRVTHILQGLLRG